MIEKIKAELKEIQEMIDNGDKKQRAYLDAGNREKAAYAAGMVDGLTMAKRYIESVLYEYEEQCPA